MASTTGVFTLLFIILDASLTILSSIIMTRENDTPVVLADGIVSILVNGTVVLDEQSCTWLSSIS